MSNSEIETMLANLKAIKRGEDPRSRAPPTPKPKPEPEPKQKPKPKPKDALAVMEAEVDRLYEEHPEFADDLPRSNLWTGVSRNDGRNGVCYFGKRLTKRRFNKQVTGTVRKAGHVSIVINEKIFEEGNVDGFIDTVRHEVAHAIAYAKHPKYPSRQKHRDYDPYYSGHGGAWKNIARAVGASAKSCHNKRDRSNEFKYYVGCSNCGKEYGRTKRSKIVQKPFKRVCQCGHSPLSSYDAGDEMPEEDGTVAVKSIPWSNKKEYWDHKMNRR